MKQKSLKINAILNSVKTIMGIIFPLVTFPYISRVLNVDDIGRYNFSSSIISYFILLAGLGITTYAVREGSKFRENKEKLNEFVSQVFSINLISTIISYCLLFFCIFNISKLQDYKMIILILSLEILFTTIGIGWIYNVFEEYLYITIRTIVFQILSLILIFIFVRTSNDLYNYVAIVAFSSSGSNIMNFFCVRKYCDIKIKFNKTTFKHLKPILIIFFTTIAITIYVSSDMTMLGIMTSDYETGLYSVSVKIYNILKNLLVSILIVLIPRFSILSDSDKDEFNKLFVYVLKAMLVIILPIVVGLFMVSKDVILLVAGDSYIEANTSLKLLSLSIMFSFLAYIYTQCILIPFKKESIVLKSTIISAVVNIILNIILIPLWGINAVAFTTIIAELLVFLIGYNQSKSLVKISGLYSDLKGITIGCICIVVICGVISHIIYAPYIRLFFSVSLSVIMYILVLFINKNSIILIYIKRICRKLKYSLK